jgi:hypothetical protein
LKQPSFQFIIEQIRSYDNLSMFSDNNNGFFNDQNPGGGGFGGGRRGGYKDYDGGYDR